MVDEGGGGEEGFSYPWLCTEKLGGSALANPDQLAL